jgi:hypothetical protein
LNRSQRIVPPQFLSVWQEQDMEDPMGVLTDYFLASPAELERLKEDIVPAEEFDSVDAKGIDQVKLAQLYEIVCGLPYLDAMSRFRLVHEVSEDGPWTTTVDPELVSALADLSDSELLETASRWSKIEEFTLDGWSESDVMDVLTRLQQLAKEAVENEKNHVSVDVSLARTREGDGHLFFPRLRCDVNAVDLEICCHTRAGYRKKRGKVPRCSLFSLLIRQP